jgi:hypothetical protein
MLGLGLGGTDPTDDVHVQGDTDGAHDERTLMYLAGLYQATIVWFRLVEVEDGCLRPLVAIGRSPGATSRHRGCGSVTGRWGWCLLGSGSTICIGAGPDSSAR